MFFGLRIAVVKLAKIKVVEISVIHKVADAGTLVRIAFEKRNTGLERVGHQVTRAATATRLFPNAIAMRLSRFRTSQVGWTSSRERSLEIAIHLEPRRHATDRASFSPMITTALITIRRTCRLVARVI